MKGRDHLGEIGVAEKVILKWIGVEGCRLDSSGSG
jgi:hypothetical protein